MPTTGRTAARNYRDRRTLTSSSGSDSSPERLRLKPLPQGTMKRQRSHSRSPHRSYPPQRPSSRGHRPMKLPGRSKIRMLPHSLKPGGPPPIKRSHSPHRSDFSPPRKSSHHSMGDYERPHGSKREEYMSRKHSSKEPSERKHDPPSRPPPGREMHEKFRMEDKYRVGQVDYVQSHKSEPLPSHSKGDLDMRDMRMAPDFAHKDRVPRGRDVMQPMTTQSQTFMAEKKDHSLMRDELYNRGDSLRRSPDRHGPTLDERFRHSTEKPADTRMHFDREELEKITIDIRRNVREPSPTVRRIANPEEIKVVRRSGEGHRPIFEREEIKKPLVDLREEASCERRVSIAKRDVVGNDDYALSRKQPSLESGEMRSREYMENSRQLLSDRFQNYGDRKPNMQMLRPRRDPSEERRHSYKPRGSSPMSYRESEFQGTKNIGRDLPRDDRPYDREPRIHQSRDSMDDRRDGENRDYMRPFLDDPGDLRHSLLRRKEGSFSDDQNQFSERSRERRDSKGSSGYWRDSAGKNVLDVSSGRFRESRSRQRSRSHSPIHERERQREGSREDRGVDFSQRPDRFKYAPWSEKPEVIPKGPSYYESSQNNFKPSFRSHDDRGENDLNRRRGRGRMLRPHGFRGRSSRGNFRGNYRGRMFRGNMTRGRPFFRRGIGGRSSPRHWEHDLFNKSPEKNDN